jgi:hypothetical protein
MDWTPPTSIPGAAIPIRLPERMALLRRRDVAPLARPFPARLPEPLLEEPLRVPPPRFEPPLALCRLVPPPGRLRPRPPFLDDDFFAICVVCSLKEHRNQYSPADVSFSGWVCPIYVQRRTESRMAYWLAAILRAELWTDRSS